MTQHGNRGISVYYHNYILSNQQHTACKRSSGLSSDFVFFVENIYKKLRHASLEIFFSGQYILALDVRG